MRNQQDRPRHTLTSVRLLVMVAFAAVAVGVVDTRA
jgi:hypothetical protein